MKRHFPLIFALVVGGVLLHTTETRAQSKTVWTDDEKPIVQQLHTLRSLPDDVRARTTKELALTIRKLPAGSHKLDLANDLANLSTEGDFGRETLQEVTTTLADALTEHPVPEEKGHPAAVYVELAELVRYEHMQGSLDSPEFSSAMTDLESEDAERQHADFTLTDINGQRWNLGSLRGKVVLLNFWATWCPPCRKEMPTLEILYDRFKSQGLVVLAISDEEIAKVKPYISTPGFSYPVLLDSGRKVNGLYHVKGIPRTFVYNRDGKMVAESIDMRTQKQFLGMLSEAGLK